MKFPFTSAILSLTTLVASDITNSAIKLSILGENQNVLSDSVDNGNGFVVPGDNPLEYCDTNRNTDVLKLHHINLMPNPPSKGEKLFIEAVGELLDDVQPGAYVKINVKYGMITILDKVVDLCDRLSNVDLNCPLEKGPVTLQKEVDLPREIPPGTFNVVAEAFTADDKRLVCLKTHVRFDV